MKGPVLSWPMSAGTAQRVTRRDLSVRRRSPGIWHCSEASASDLQGRVNCLRSRRYSQGQRLGIWLPPPGISTPRICQMGGDLSKICPEMPWARQDWLLVSDKQKPRKTIGFTGFSMVGVARIELATPAMSTQCSTTELHAHGGVGQ